MHRVWILTLTLALGTFGHAETEKTPADEAESWGPLAVMGGMVVGGYLTAERVSRIMPGSSTYAHEYSYPDPNGAERIRGLGDRLAAAIRESNGYTSNLTTRYPKIFQHLMASSKVNYRLPFEGDLQAWVMQKSNNSVTPEDLFREALTLAHGDVGEALLGVHNALRNIARYKSSYTRNLNVVSDSYSKLFFDKFVDIRGDLVEAGGKGDHPGSWYRMFGMILNTYMTALNKDGSASIRKNLILTRATQSGVAAGAEMIKPIALFPEKDMWGKLGFNLQSVNIGVQMMTSLRDQPTGNMVKLCTARSLL